MKRTLLAFLAIFLLATISVSANPILLAPSGNTLTTTQVRAEAALSVDNDNGKYFWLGTGLMQLEINVIQRNLPNGTNQSRLGAQWSFLPETSLTPGVGFGVTDVTNETGDGAGIYAAITKHLPVARINPLFKDLAVTAGVGVGGIDGPFFGVETHLPMNLFVQGEYDSSDFNGAIGWQPIKMFRVKAYTIHDDTFFGAEIPPIQF